LSKNKNVEFAELLKSFLDKFKETEAIIISDQESFIIAGEKRKDVDMELVSFLTAIVNPILERIRSEFAFQKFGTATFDTDEHRLMFISVSNSITLSFVFEALASTDKLSPYAYFLAEKTAQFIEADENTILHLKLPSFDYDLSLSPEKKVRGQLYRDQLATGGIYRFKFIIIGDHEVGKTSIIRRFVDNKFSVDYRATIGLNILPHKFEVFGNTVNLSLWDIGAQEYFKRYRKTYYNGAQAAFIVFDLSNRSSFENIYTWYNELKEFTNTADIPMIIIGNKNDLVEKRKINKEEAFELVKTLSELSEFSVESELSNFTNLADLAEGSGSKIVYIETSAKTGENIIDAFTLLSYHYILTSWKIEEERLKGTLIEVIQDILEDKDKLTISFLTEDILFSPGFQTLVNLESLGNYREIKNKKKEKIIQFDCGLILKNFSTDSFNVSDSDAVFCIFDNRGNTEIDAKWNDVVLKVIQKLPKSKVIIIGVRISEKNESLDLVSEFDVKDQAEKKQLSILFFNIGEDIKHEIYEQLDAMLISLKNQIYSY